MSRGLNRVLADRRVRRPAVLSLALLSVFTMGAGAAVARLLPERQALWRPAALVTPRLVQAGPVLSAADAPSSAQAATGAGITSALSAQLSAPALGGHVGAQVDDLSTGQVLFGHGNSGGFAPASTAKLTTAVASLHVLGAGARLTTKVVSGPGAGTIILVGGGDPTLAAGAPPAGDYPQPATLQDLAARTARALRARGTQSVHLGYDTSLFSGPLLAPGWTNSYVTTGNVTPIQSLEVDQGRLTPGGAPEDADDATNPRARTFTPAAQAAQAFASFLSADGITVSAPAQQQAAAHSATLASVSSPTVAQMVDQMLLESNNVIAENLARQVAMATGKPATFAGAAAAVTQVLAGLGVSGISLADGSGLSPQDRISPAALVEVVRLAAAPGQPGLRPALGGLPVAGFSGTLSAGGSVFGGIGQAARGVVRAKTGNLLTVVSLAGIAYDSSGELLAFAFMADQLPAGGLTPAASDITGLATSLAACGCNG